MQHQGVCEHPPASEPTQSQGFPPCACVASVLSRGSMSMISIMQRGKACCWCRQVSTGDGSEAGAVAAAAAAEAARQHAAHVHLHMAGSLEAAAAVAPVLVVGAHLEVPTSHPAGHINTRQQATDRGEGVDRAVSEACTQLLAANMRHMMCAVLSPRQPVSILHTSHAGCKACLSTAAPSLQGTCRQHPTTGVAVYTRPHCCCWCLWRPAYPAIHWRWWPACCW